MHTRITRAACAAAAAGALTAVSLLAGAGAAAVPGSAAAGQAGKVPAGFQPAAASFYSPASGVVLGGVGCLSGKPCRARLAATSDGGARWHFIGVPDVGVTVTVSEVVFANQRDGWLYQYSSGKVRATHDGGARWRRLSLGGDIETMAASAQAVYAVVSRGAVDELFSSPLGRDAWARVGTITGSSGAALAVSGNAAWFGPGTAGTGTYLWATADGVRWHRYPFSCPASENLQVGIAAASRSQVVFLCATPEGTVHTVKEVLRSVNGGRTEHLTGYAPVGGDFYGGFAVPPHRAKVITIAVSGAAPSSLDRSANGGKTWTGFSIPGTAGGATLNSLAYVSPTVGWVVVDAPEFPGRLHQLLRTSDAGRAWHAVRF